MMNSDTQVTIGFIILVVGFLFTAYNFVKSNKHDINAENFIKVNLKLDELCRGNSEIKDEVRITNNEIKQIREEQIKHDQQIKAIWRAIDDLKVHNDE